MNGKPTIADGALAILLADFALPAQQIAHARDPAAPTHALFGTSDQSRRMVGRPYFIWKDDLDLARQVNERLAASSST